MTLILWALAAAVALCGVIILGLALAPDAMLHDYPPALQERYGEQSVRGKRADVAASVLMLVVAVTMAVLALRSIGDAGFVDGFVLGVLTVVFLTVLDTVVIDWLMFCRLQWPIFVLPGTEGDPAYRDYAFHVKALWPRGLALIPLFGLVYGALAWVVGGG